MNFMFEWQEQYLTRSLRSLVRYCSCHSNIKFISSRHRVISSIYLSLTLCLRTCLIQTLWHVPLGVRINEIPLYFEFELLFTRLHVVIAISFCYCYYLTNSPSSSQFSSSYALAKLFCELLGTDNVRGKIS